MFLQEHVCSLQKGFLQESFSYTSHTQRGPTNKTQGPSTSLGMTGTLHISFLPVLVAAAEIVDEHLLDGFVVSNEHMADGASADEVADFLGKILGVIAGALERLRHEDDLQAGLTVNVLGILDVAQEDEIAKAVHLGVSAEDVNRLAHVAFGERNGRVGEHFFQQRGHLCEVTGIFRVNAPAYGLSAVGKAKE